MLSDTDVRRLRGQLLALRDRVDAKFARVRQEAFRGAGGESGGGISNAPIHLGDLGSQEFDQSVTLGLAEKEAAMRYEIEDALHRIRTGDFGTCEACGRTIPKERLKIVPYARQCVACATKTQAQMTPTLP